MDQVATDELIDLENRVLLAQKIFPNEAQVAMDIAQMKGTSEFIVINLEHDRLTGAKRTSSGLKMTPEEYQTRLNAVSKTVKFAKRFFPRCSALLDVIMDCEDLTQLACGEEEDTPEIRQQKKKRYMEIQETVKTAFSKDKEELGHSNLTASCSSTSKSTAKKRSTGKQSQRCR